jgi:hypothetical protein
MLQMEGDQRFSLIRKLSNEGARLFHGIGKYRLKLVPCRREAD